MNKQALSSSITGHIQNKIIWFPSTLDTTYG